MEKQTQKTEKQTKQNCKKTCKCNKKTAEKTEKCKKGTRGITLIALIVTIIVLLLLAGVTIATLTGDNGILAQAQKAKESTEVAKFRDEVQLAYMTAYSENAKNGTYTVSMEDVLGRLVIDYPEYDDDEKIVEGEQGSISAIKAKWGNTEVNTTNGVLIPKQGTEVIEVVPVGSPGEGLTKFVLLDGKYYEIILNGNGVTLGEAQDSVQRSTVAVEIKEKTGLDSVTATPGNNKKITLEAGNSTASGTIKIGYGVHEVTVKVEVKEGYIITALPDDTNKGTVTITPSNENNKYAEGSTITIEAEAKPGYKFKKWSDDNSTTEQRTITVSSTTAAVTYTAIFEEKNAIGSEVTIGDEHFYIIKKYTENNVDKVTLISKYNLATEADETTGKYYQQNADYGTTAFRFSNSNYWSSEWVSGTRINLNTYETTYNTTMPAEEDLSNNALLRARKYGQDLGGTGRLLTYDEANTNDSTNCLFKTSKMETILYGRYTGDDQVGGSSGNGYLYYWLASSYEDYNNCVWYVWGSSGYLRGVDYDNTGIFGIRPVIEVDESVVQEV